MALSTILSGVRMSNKRLSMRQIKEVLRLRFVCERSQREIATTIGLSSATVWDYLVGPEKLEAPCAARV